MLSGTRRHDHCEGVHEAASVDAGATIQHSIVGAGATVGAATVTRSVVLPGAVVESGAVVADSVVMGRVGAGAAVHHSVLGADGVVAPGEQMSDQRRPDPNAGPSSA